jgi:hypothetical protein
MTEIEELKATIRTQLDRAWNQMDNNAMDRQLILEALIESLREVVR